MRNSRSIAGVATATLLLAGLGVAGASSASAQDDGPLQVGHIFLFKNHKNLATATAADQVTGGPSFAGRPFTSAAVDASCPAGTAQVQLVTRLKTAAAEANWDEVPMGASEAYVEDANGHAYLDTPMDNFNLSSIQMAVGSTAQTLPLALVCMDENAATTGYFTTDVTIQPLSSPGWALVSPASLPAASTTTTLGTLPASVEQGTPVSLSATVSPSSATGSVEYFDGTTSLGTSALGTPLVVSTLSVGTHSITATYPGTTGFGASTSAAGTVVVTTVAPRSTTTSLTADVVTGAPYQAVTLTAAVSASTGTATGSVEFFDKGVSLGTSPLTAGAATLTRNTFGAGDHAFTAKYLGNAPYTESTSVTAVSATYVALGSTDLQTVDVAIPAGSITITTPYNLAYDDAQGVHHDATPLHLGSVTLDPVTSTFSASAKFGDTSDPAKAIKITDTRAGNLGFTATVQSGDFSNGVSSFGGEYAGLTGLNAVGLPGNALKSTDVTLTPHAPFVDGLATA